MSLPTVAPLSDSNWEPLPQNVVAEGVTVPEVTLEHALPLVTVRSAGVEFTVAAQFIAWHRYPYPFQLMGTFAKVSVLEDADEVVEKPE